MAEAKWKDAQVLVEQALEEAARCSKSEEKRLETLQVQADVYRSLKQWNSAVEVSKELRELSSKIHGERSKQSADALCRLSDNLMSAGQSVKARDLLEKSIKVIEDKYGKNDIYLVRPLRMLGELLLDTDYSLFAVPHLERSLAIQKASLGGDSEATVETLVILGRTYLYLGRWSEARTTLLEAKSLAEKTHSPWIGDVLITLGDYRSKVWDQNGAFEYYMQALAQKPRTKDQRYYLRLQLAEQFVDRKDYEKAKEYLNQVVKSHNSDPNVGMKYMDKVYQLLAICAERQEEYSKAVLYLEAAIKFRKAGKDYMVDDTVMFLYWQLAEVYKKNGEHYKEARALENACELMLESLQNDRDMRRGNIQKVVFSLMNYHHRHKNYQYCRKFLYRLDKLEASRAGPGHVKMKIYVPYLYGRYYENFGMHQQAFQYYLQCLEQCRAINEMYGIYGPVMQKLAGYYRAMGKVEEAKKLEEDFRIWNNLSAKKHLEDRGEATSPKSGR